jgi:hypothetical protein
MEAGCQNSGPDDNQQAQNQYELSLIHARGHFTTRPDSSACYTAATWKVARGLSIPGHDMG